MQECICNYMYKMSLNAFYLDVHGEVESELEGNNGRCRALEEAQRGFVSVQEVKEVQDDITRFWLCVKSLDSGKASKQDMDAMVLEMSKVTRRALHMSLQAITHVYKRF